MRLAEPPAIAATGHGILTNQVSAYRMVCAVCLLVFINQINSKLASLKACAHGDAT